MPRGIRNSSNAGNGNGNGHRWGAITEVQIGEVPPPMRSPWSDLYDDVLLRLEQTSDRFALRIPVANKKEGASCVGSLRKSFNRHPGPETVCLAVREKHGEASVFIWRGPAWPK